MAGRLIQSLRALLASRLGGNIASLMLLQAFTYLLPLLTVPYMVRVLGAEKFGIIAFVYAVITFFNILVDYGFNLSATRAIAVAAAHDDMAGISAVFNAVMAAKALLGLAGMGVLGLLVWLVPAMEVEASLYAAIYMVVIGNVLFPVWLFQGMGQMKYLTVVNVIAKSCVVAGIFALVHQQDDYVLAAGIQSAGFVLTGVLSWLFLHKVARLTLYVPSWSGIRLVFADGWHVFLSTVAISFYASSATFILGLFVSPAVLGYYAAADKVIKLVHEMVRPISQAVYPHVAGLKEASAEQALGFIHKLIGWQGGVALLISAVLFVTADSIVLLLFGPEYEASIVLIRIMAFLPFIIGLSNIFGIQVMLNFGLKAEFSRIVMLSGLFNSLMVVPLSYYQGANGAASSIVLTECFVTVSMFRALVKNKLIKMPLAGGVYG